MPARTRCCGRGQAAGKSEMLERYAQGLSRQGPHDQPQSMCPAFGSLRVGLRMRRTATILSGSACCVYGLTFTSHFYGARRTRRLRAVQLRDAGHRQAVRGHPRGGVTSWPTRRCTTRSSSPICACRRRRGVPLQLLPKEINGVRIIGIDVPGFGVPTHAEAKDVLAGAMLSYARTEAEQGPVQAPRDGAQRQADGHAASARCSRPIRSVIGMMLEPLGLAAGPVVPTREWRELYAALDCAVVAAIHPFYTAVVPRVRGGGPPDRRLGAGRPRRHRRLARGDRRRVRRRRRTRSTPRRTGSCRRSAARWPTMPIKGRITLSGYEGSELLVGRLLVESGADVRYVGTACPRTAWSRARPRVARGQGRARAVPRVARAGPRGDARVRARPRHRHHAGGAEGEGARASRRCTSPT